MFIFGLHLFVMKYIDQTNLIKTHTSEDFIPFYELLVGNNNLLYNIKFGFLYINTFSINFISFINEDNILLMTLLVLPLQYFLNGFIKIKFY